MIDRDPSDLKVEFKLVVSTMDLRDPPDPKIIVELPIPSRPVWSLTCPLLIPYPSPTCPLPVPYLSLTCLLPVPCPSLTHLASLGLSRSLKGTGTDTIFDFSHPPPLNYLAVMVP